MLQYGPKITSERVVSAKKGLHRVPCSLFPWKIFSLELVYVLIGASYFSALGFPCGWGALVLGMFSGRLAISRHWGFPRPKFMCFRGRRSEAVLEDVHTSHAKAWET